MQLTHVQIYCTEETAQTIIETVKGTPNVIVAVNNARLQAIANGKPDKKPKLRPRGGTGNGFANGQIIKDLPGRLASLYVLKDGERTLSQASEIFASLKFAHTSAEAYLNTAVREGIASRERDVYKLTEEGKRKLIGINWQEEFARQEARRAASNS